MTERQRISNILGAGTYAQSFLPKLCTACERLGATTGILTMGRFEFNRATASEPTDFGRDGIIDVSPSPDEIKNAVGNANSDEIAETNRDAWEPPAARMSQRVLQALAAAGLIDGQALWFQGLRTGHGRPAEEWLREFKRRQPRQFITAASTLPDDFDKRDRLRDGHDLFFRLWREKVIDATFLVDNASLFARAHSLDTQDRFQATAYASLLAAQSHFARNSSLAEYSRALGDYGAYIGMRFASRSIVVSKEIPWWGLMRKAWKSLPARGSASPASIFLEAKTATEQAITVPDAAAIDEPVNEDLPLCVVYTVPLPRQSQIWTDFTRDMRTWLANHFPKATPVFTSGNGMAYPNLPGDYWLQASVLYPLPDVPKPIQTILAAKSMRRSRGTDRTEDNVTPLAARTVLSTTKGGRSA